MQQHRQLSRHRDHRPLLRVLAAARRDLFAVPTQLAILPERAENVMRAADEKLPQISIPRLGNVQLLIRIARLIAFRHQPEVRPNLATFLEPRRIVNRQDKRRGRDWADALDLPQPRNRSRLTTETPSHGDIF